MGCFSLAMGRSKWFIVAGYTAAGERIRGPLLHQAKARYRISYAPGEGNGPPEVGRHENIYLMHLINNVHALCG